MECRALRAEEREQWFDHVDEVFAHTPRAYFERHYHNDPWLSEEGIRVAVDPEREDRIASTVRVFVRRALVDGRQVPCGGIGEVSTKADYRKQGLASRLLLDAENWMRKQDMAFGLLHTRSAAPLYRSLGWHSITMRYSVISAPLSSLAYAHQRTTSQYSYQLIDVTNADQLRSIAQVHAAYALHFNGTFVRDELAYWHKWIAYEFNRETARSALALDAATGRVVGYASAFVKEDGAVELTSTEALVSVRLREFGVVDEVVAADGGQSLLGSLVGFLLQPIRDGDEGRGHKRVRLVYPEAIENYFADASVVPDGRREESQVDEGTMVHVLDDSAVGTELELEQLLHRRPSTAKANGSAERASYLLFWELDGF